MTEKMKRKSPAPAAKRAPAQSRSETRGKAPGAKKTGVKKTGARNKGPAPKTVVKVVKTRSASRKKRPAVGSEGARTKQATDSAADEAKRSAATQAPARKSTAMGAAPEAKSAGAKARTTKAKPEESLSAYRIGEPVLDPIGDLSSGEAKSYLGDLGHLAEAEMEAFRADTNNDAMDDVEAARGLNPALPGTEAHARKAAKARSEERTAAADSEVEESGVEEAEQAPREPARLERLQKILSQAGIASRRHAEEMIVSGRVMVNGQVVTQLGSKADVARDHIHVDGKLLHGAERHRYFVLNKPRGYVTTVSDPEGRPTVMQFFARMGERVYPVGRLDYQSEGLLLMTNDGELANLLTKAGSGVEKTYLVKVAGQPSEEQLERLRGGVNIEREESGSKHVRTAPAQIREVREGDNPWYEVVLTEGRNRELRKMFAAIGHFAEKIRRVGYGPLELDVEPGEMRELTPQEVNALRLTAEGKMKPKRLHPDRTLPKDAGQMAEEGKPFQPRGGQDREWRLRHGDFRGREETARHGEFGGRREERVFGGQSTQFDRRPRFDRAGSKGGPRRVRGGGGIDGGRKPLGDRGERSFGGSGGKQFRAHGERPYFKRGAEPKGRFERRAGPGTRFEKRPERNWQQRPDQRRDQRRNEEPRRPAGRAGRSGAAFRGNNRAGQGAADSERSNRSFTPQRGPGGFARPGGKGSSGTARRSGPYRPDGRRGGRPSGRKRG